MRIRNCSLNQRPEGRPLMPPQCKFACCEEAPKPKAERCRCPQQCVRRPPTPPFPRSMAARLTCSRTRASGSRRGARKYTYISVAAAATSSLRRVCTASLANAATFVATR